LIDFGPLVIFGGSFGRFRSGRWSAAEMRHLPFLCLLLLWIIENFGIIAWFIHL